jgi:hypothetical protein
LSAPSSRISSSIESLSMGGGGSSLNILFLRTFHQMGLSISALHPSQAPFHGIVSRVAVTSFSQITLLATFGAWGNFRTEYMQFEVANFETEYNVFLGSPALTKFMAIHHYAYLVLKMPGPNSVISIKGDVKHVYDYDKETYETTDMPLASVELKELKKALAESHPDPIMPEAKMFELSIQLEDTLSKTIPLSLDEPSKVAHVGNSLDPK